MGDKYAWIYRSSTRSIDGRGVIVHDRVGVKGHPFRQSGQPPGEVEARVTFSRVIPRHLLRGWYITETCEAVPERSEGQRHMPLAGKNDDPGKPKFNIW